MGKTSFTIAFLKPEIASGVYSFTPTHEKAPLSSRSASAPGSSRGFGNEDPSEDTADNEPPQTPLRSSITGVTAAEASLLYPDGQILSNVFARITKAGFVIHRKRMVQLTRPQVRSLFGHEALRLKDEAKFRAFLESFTSGLSMALLLAYPESSSPSDAVTKWKALVGHESPVVARQDALSASLPHDEWPLRALCGLDAVQNAIQSSASLDCFYREKALVFPDANSDTQNRLEKAIIVLLPSFLNALPEGKALLLAKLNTGGVLVSRRDDDYRFASVKELTVLLKQLHPVTNEQHREEFMLGLQQAVGMDVDAGDTSSSCCCLLEVDALDLPTKLRGLLGPAPIDEGHLYFPESIRAQLTASLAPSSLSHVRTAGNEATCLESGIFVSFDQRTIAALTKDASVNEIQQTFAIIKPGTASDPAAVREIQNAIRAFGFAIEKQRRLRLTRAQAATFYGEHRGKAFFERLLAFMTSGELVAMQLSRKNAILTWRGLMGPTNALVARETHPWTLRARFGVDGTRNATHGSDAPVSARRELKFFFGGGLQAFAGVFNSSNSIQSTKVLAQSRLLSPYSPDETLESVVTQALDEMFGLELPTQLDACKWLGTWLLEYSQRQQLKHEDEQPRKTQAGRAKLGLPAPRSTKPKQQSVSVVDPLEQHFGSNRTLLAVSYTEDVSPQLRAALGEALSAVASPRFVFLDVNSVSKMHKDLQSAVAALMSQLKAAGKRRFLLHDMDVSSSALVEAFNAQTVDWRINSAVTISSSAAPAKSTASAALAPVVPHVFYQLPLQSVEVVNGRSFKTFFSELLDPVLVVVCDQQKHVEGSHWRDIALHFGYVLLEFEDLVHKRIAKERDPNGVLTQLVRTRAKIPSELLCALVSDVVRNFQPNMSTSDNANESMGCAQKFLLCGFPFAEALPTEFEKSVASMHRLLHVHSKQQTDVDSDANGWISHASKRGALSDLWIDPGTSLGSLGLADELRVTCALSLGPVVGFCTGEMGGEQLGQLTSAAQALGFIWVDARTLCPPQEDRSLVISKLKRVLLRANAGREKFLLCGFPLSKAALVAFMESVCMPRFAILSNSSKLQDMVATLNEFPQIVQLDISQSPESNSSSNSSTSSLGRLQSVLFGKRVSFLVGDTTDVHSGRLQNVIAAHGYSVLDLRKQQQQERLPEVDTLSNDVVPYQVQNLLSQIQTFAASRCLVLGAPEHLDFVSSHGNTSTTAGLLTNLILLLLLLFSSKHWRRSWVAPSTSSCCSNARSARRCLESPSATTARTTTRTTRRSSSASDSSRRAPPYLLIWTSCSSSTAPGSAPVVLYQLAHPSLRSRSSSWTTRSTRSSGATCCRSCSLSWATRTHSTPAR